MKYARVFAPLLRYAIVLRAQTARPTRIVRDALYDALAVAQLARAIVQATLVESARPDADCAPQTLEAVNVVGERDDDQKLLNEFQQRKLVAMGAHFLPVIPGSRRQSLRPASFSRSRHVLTYFQRRIYDARTTSAP